MTTTVTRRLSVAGHCSSEDSQSGSAEAGPSYPAEPLFRQLQRTISPTRPRHATDSQAALGPEQQAPSVSETGQPDDSAAWTRATTTSPPSSGCPDDQTSCPESDVLVPQNELGRSPEIASNVQLGGEQAQVPCDLGNPGYRQLKEAYIDGLEPINPTVLAKWEDRVRQHLDAILNRELGDDCFYAQELFWVAERSRFRDKVGPFRQTILVSVDNRDQKRAFERCMGRHTWLKEAISACNLRLLVVVDHITLQAGPTAPDTSSDNPNKAVVDRQACAISWARVNIPFSGVLCGTRATIAFQQKAAPQACTIGGIILINEVAFGLTAGHPFLPGLQSSAKQEDDRPEDGSISLSASETEDLLWNRSSGGIDFFEFPERLPLEASYLIELAKQQAGDEENYEIAVAAYPLSPRTPGEYPERVPRNNDWGLVSISHIEFIEYSNNFCLPSGQIKEIASLALLNSAATTLLRAEIICGAEHVITGIIRPGEATYRTGGFLLRTQLIILDEDIPLCSSGAWVVVDRTLFGIIVAARGPRWAYMMPIRSVLEDICRTFKVQSVGLPSRPDAMDGAEWYQVNRDLISGASALPSGVFSLAPRPQQISPRAASPPLNNETESDTSMYDLTTPLGRVSVSKSVSTSIRRTSTASTNTTNESRPKIVIPDIVSWLAVSPAAMARDPAQKYDRDPKTYSKVPKRGLSAYMFFANEQRDTVCEENPGISFGQVGKVLGEKWKALSDKQREPYEKKAAADKKRYEDERAKYNAADSDDNDDDQNVETATMSTGLNAATGLSDAQRKGRKNFSIPRHATGRQTSSQTNPPSQHQPVAESVPSRSATSIGSVRSVADTELGLTPGEIQLLRRQQEVMAQRAHQSSGADRGRGTSRHAQSSSRAVDSTTPPNRVSLDPGYLSELQTHLDNVMRQIGTRFDELEEATERSVNASSGRPGRTSHSAGADLERMQRIVADIDRLDADFKRIAHIKEVIKRLRARIEQADSRVDRVTSSQWPQSKSLARGASKTLQRHPKLPREAEETA